MNHAHKEFKQILRIASNKMLPKKDSEAEVNAQQLSNSFGIISKGRNSQRRYG
jgi:hypothetical protein